MAARDELHKLIIERFEEGDNLHDVMDLLETEYADLLDRFLNENADWLVRGWIEKSRKHWQGKQNQVQKRERLWSERDRYTKLTKYLRDHPRG